MKNLIIQSLETKGVLGQIRAELRSSVFKIVDEQDQQYNFGCGLKWENPTLYKILETGDTNISSRKNSIIVGTRRDNSFFIDSKHKKTSKKKCEC